MSSLNGRMLVYLEATYAGAENPFPDGADFMTLLTYDQAQRTGTATARFLALIAAANAHEAE
ncbi:MAG: hypothetical protein GEV06_19800 [Luteitalea sp.]|nr:hypothetical protein [Luteitalea sp.]